MSRKTTRMGGGGGGGAPHGFEEREEGRTKRRRRGFGVSFLLLVSISLYGCFLTVRHKIIKEEVEFDLDCDYDDNLPLSSSNF